MLLENRKYFPLATNRLFLKSFPNRSHRHQNGIICLATKLNNIRKLFANLIWINVRKFISTYTDFFIGNSLDDND